MSGPMFIRDPKVGASQAFSGASAAIAGQDLSTPSAISWTELLFDVEEPVLVESIRAIARLYSSAAGQILVGLKNEEYGHSDYVYIVAAFAIPAGTVDPGPFAAVDEDVEITVPAGWSLVVAHSVASGSHLDITAHGGVVR